MEEVKELSEILTTKIDDIQKQVINGKINLLNYELVPLFIELQKIINVNYLDENSKTYMKACNLLEQKFEELRKLLGSLDNEQKFMEYLKLKPDDREINQLFEGCWRETFNLNPISLEFLELSKDKLSKLSRKRVIIEHLKKRRISGEDFLLSVPERGFSEQMLDFYESILDKLP
ncbi:MAG: hypothetical protein ACFFAT_17670, partial [Promethearchaeota archaeon]